MFSYKFYNIFWEIFFIEYIQATNYLWILPWSTEHLEILILIYDQRPKCIMLSDVPYCYTFNTWCPLKGHIYLKFKQTGSWNLQVKFKNISEYFRAARSNEIYWFFYKKACAALSAWTSWIFQNSVVFFHTALLNYWMRIHTI